jgi:hypothetical protein
MLPGCAVGMVAGIEAIEQPCRACGAVGAVSRSAVAHRWRFDDRSMRTVPGAVGLGVLAIRTSLHARNACLVS